MQILAAPRKSTASARPERLAVSIREAGEMLGVCERTVYYMIERGEILSRKAGSRTLISLESLRRFMEGNEANQ